MKKEKILALSRNQHQDEGFEHIIINANKYGTIIFCIMMVVLLCLAVITWRISDITLLICILWGYMAGYSYGLAKTNNESRIFMTSLCSVVSIGFFISYLTIIF